VKGGRLKRGFKKRCEEKSVELRNQLGLTSHDRLLSESLADHLGITIDHPEDIPDLDDKYIKRLVDDDPFSWSAVTITTDGHTFIISNSRHSASRHESNFMHELSHVILEHSPVRIKAAPGFPFPMREDRRDDEEEAEWLGGCLQIPRDGLLWALKRNMSDSRSDDRFGSSVDMVRFRRNMTGVDKQFKRLRRYPR